MEQEQRMSELALARARQILESLPDLSPQEQTQSAEVVAVLLDVAATTRILEPPRPEPMVWLSEQRGLTLKSEADGLWTLMLDADSEGLLCAGSLLRVVGMAMERLDG